MSSIEAKPQALPSCMVIGTKFTKMHNTSKGSKTIFLKYDAGLQRLTWDSRKLGVIQLEWILYLKTGTDIQSFPPSDDKTIPNRLAICYLHKGTEMKLNLIAPSASIAQDWYNYLTSKLINSEHFTSKRINIACNAFDMRLESWLRYQWSVVDKNKDGKIVLKEFKTFLNLINYECSESELKSLFKTLDSKDCKYLDFEATKQLFYILQLRPEVHKLYASIVSHSEMSSLSEEDFYSFLRIQQKENHSPEMLKSLFHRYSQGNPLELSEKQFLCYLCSEDNSALRSIEDHPKHDMNYPLNDYWINSSHNTYLTGDQIKSPSSTSMYKDALLKGCRCVELDCWDGPKGEPIIYHGFTLTSKIFFKDVIETIRDHAFTASPYPIILSLEVHCSLAQQDMMANYLKTILGDSLVENRLEDPSIEPNNHRLPSPNQLLNKIIIKGKSLEPFGSSQMDLDTSKNTMSSNINSSISDRNFNESKPLLLKDESGNPIKAKEQTEFKVSKLLSDLTPYCQTEKFKDFQHAQENAKYFQMSSFSEDSLLESFKKCSLKPHMLDFLRHNQKFLSRVFPGGLRIDSSNFNPLPFWLAGFQLVALNYQTFDLGMLINQSMFRQNRQLGYILKPEYMRQLNPALPLPKPTKYRLQVRVISGQNLPKPDDKATGEVIDPQIEVEMVTVEHGLQFLSGQASSLGTQSIINLYEETSSAEDLAPIVARKSLKSEVVMNNGFNPSWTLDAIFSFSSPEFSFLKFKVIEFNVCTVNSIIGQFCVRVADLKPGYRHIPILNNNGVEYPFASLFIFTNIEEYMEPSVQHKAGPSEVTKNQYPTPVSNTTTLNKPNLDKHLDSDICPPHTS
ncbi:hypothetical protein DSO57_1014857 [Entomophthora muscae]|uniref:Uncharacterized protein n=1 Tax=Entomophthora muscae TaxID=34485 RepID=A0ACC2RWL4_9FUNG|nr:hypothetical protein DSO57_1014857 [Entomophthora muscae]